MIAAATEADAAHALAAVKTRAVTPATEVDAAWALTSSHGSSARVTDMFDPPAPAFPTFDPPSPEADVFDAPEPVMEVV